MILILLHTCWSRAQLPYINPPPFSLLSSHLTTPRLHSSHLTRPHLLLSPLLLLLSSSLRTDDTAQRVSEARGGGYTYIELSVAVGADDGLVVDRGGGGGAGVRGGQADGGAVVAAAARGGALRAAGDQGPALPLLHRVRPGDGGAHGGRLRQANAATLPLPQRPPPRPRLLPPLEENLR